MAEVALPVPPPSIKAKPIIREKLRPWTASTKTIFDPEQHLGFTEYPETLSLKDIGRSETAGISPVAVSQPFVLFSEDAVRVMRNEMFTNEIWDNCVYSTDFAGCQLRGICPK